MSNAREILQERLARGEITSEQYKEMLSVMDEAPANSGTTGKSKEAPAGDAQKRKPKWTGWVVGGVLVFGAASIFNSIEAGKTQVLNLRSSGFFGDVISGSLLREGSSGQVYTWIEKGGKMMCPRSTYLVAGQRTSFEFVCDPMANQTGTFSMKTSPSPDEWVRTNATSL